MRRTMRLGWYAIKHRATRRHALRPKWLWWLAEDFDDGLFVCSTCLRPLVIP